VAGIFVLGKFSAQVTAIGQHEIAALMFHFAQNRIADRGVLRRDSPITGGARDQRPGGNEPLARIGKQLRRREQRQEQEGGTFHGLPPRQKFTTRNRSHFQKASAREMRVDMSRRPAITSTAGGTAVKKQRHNSYAPLK
jgi:hypothetical protein